jgi:hypothetical protein
LASSCGTATLNTDVAGLSKTPRRGRRSSGPRTACRQGSTAQAIGRGRAEQVRHATLELRHLRETAGWSRFRCRRGLAVVTFPRGPDGCDRLW